MNKDLRSYLKQLDSLGPEEWVQIKKPISPKFETTAILYQLEKEGRFPAVMFENLEGYSIPVVANLHATRKRIAQALEVEESVLVDEYRKRDGRRILPKTVNDAPVKEVVVKGEELDLGRIPIFTHFDINNAPYLTAGIIVTKDPISGIRNLSFNRCMVVDKNRLRVHMAPGMQLVRCYHNAENIDKPLEIAIIIGVHPAFAIGALALVPFDVDEYDVIGGMLQEPVPLIKCETVDLEVPAYAEIVLEGKILPHIREDEGPFGEFSGHSVGVAKHHVIELTSMMHRRNPIYQDIFTGHSEHRLMGGIPREALLYKAIRAVAPGTRAVHMPISGCCRFHCYISLDKRTDGEVRNAAFAALAADLYLKHIVIVDSDIDVYNERDVLWAIANRVQSNRDLTIIPNCQGSEIDPSAEKGGLTTKIIVDATKKSKTFPKKLSIPQETLNRIRLKDYL